MKTTDPKIQYDISAMKALSENISDKDSNGVLSAGDTINGIVVQADDFSTTDRLSEFLSQATNRDVEILHDDRNNYYLSYSRFGNFAQWEGQFRLKTGNR